MSLTLAFIMDPLDRVNIEADTSFAFMLEGFSRGHEIIHVNPADLVLEDDNVFLRGRRVEVFNKEGAHFRVVSEARVAATDCAAIFIRTDPPFDHAYLTTTWILSFAEKKGVRIINSPHGLRTANEHLFSLEVADLCPATLVSNSRSEIREWVRSQGGQAIAKPIDGHAGFGVVRLAEGDSNVNALIDMLTLEGRIPIMVQEFVGDGTSGDKRLIVIDGKVRGAICRVPKSGDHRGNVHVGGTTESCGISSSDNVIAERMAPLLKKHGLYFVGLDVIGDRLIEVNVTSPTLVQEIRRSGGPDLAKEMIDSVTGG